METRANHLWVGAVTLLLLAALAAGIVWLAQLNEASREEYRILFDQSVEGLARGSTVTYSGVPVGQVTDIELAPATDRRRDQVEVLIEINDTVAIFNDTAATLRASLTGVSTIQLERLTPEERRNRNIDDIVRLDPDAGEKPPVIIAREGGIGALLASIPDILDKSETTIERLNTLLDPESADGVYSLVRSTNRMTEGLADSTPEVRRSVRQLEATLAEAQGALAQMDTVLASADGFLNQDARALSTKLRGTLEQADTAAAALTSTLAKADPALDQLNGSTLPAANATLRDLQSTSRALRQVTERLETEGATGLLGSTPLPDYEP